MLCYFSRNFLIIHSPQTTLLPTTLHYNTSNTTTHNHYNTTTHCHTGQRSAFEVLDFSAYVLQLDQHEQRMKLHSTVDVVARYVMCVGCTAAVMCSCMYSSFFDVFEMSCVYNVG